MQQEKSVFSLFVVLTKRAAPLYPFFTKNRKFKNDLSDIVGILAEHEKSGNPITFEMIRTAVTNLYGSWDKLSPDSRDFIISTMEQGNFEQLYQAVSAEEKKSKETKDETKPKGLKSLFKKKKKKDDEEAK